MTPEKRERLVERASRYPREEYLARLFVTGAAAVLTGLLIDPFAGSLLLLGLFCPILVSYARRELALGALLADEARLARDAARVPTEDPREHGQVPA